jgi:hypothetical protein
MKRKKCIHPITRKHIEEELKILEFHDFRSVPLAGLTTALKYTCYCSRCKRIFSIRFLFGSINGIEEEFLPDYEKDLKRTYKDKIKGIEYTSNW